MSVLHEAVVFLLQREKEKQQHPGVAQQADEHIQAVLGAVAEQVADVAAAVATEE